MSLDIGSGNGRPFVKYNAKAGRWYTRGDGGEDIELQAPTCIIDFANIVSGWFLFREGQAPDRVLDPALGTRATQPTIDHKRGFVVMCYSKQSFGGAVEMSSSSMHLCNAIKDAYEQYSAAKDADPDMVPVFNCTGTVPQKDKFGTNFRPTLQLMKWAARPDELPDEPAAQDRPRPAATPRPAPPSAPVRPAVPADLASAEF